MRSDVCYYCWGEAVAHEPAHLILLWPVTPPPPLSLSQSLCFRFASILRWGAWGLKEDRNGGKGASLKGIITVSPEDVHNHSV